ncbi:MAG TPA: hypothetical protein VNT75_15495 [Symbiobacteriaceae bacterium]|nr:hypothetical protein [Symbiobacteriaceae bacterium]
MVQRLTAFPARADRWIAWFSAVAGGGVCLLLWVIALQRSSAAAVSSALALTLLIGLPTVSVFASGNELTEEGLWLKQGFYFRTLIPWSAITGARALSQPIRSWSAGLQVRDGGLYVKMSGANLVQVQLEQPRRFFLLGSWPFYTGRYVSFNAPDPEETAATIRRLAHLTS